MTNSKLLLAILLFFCADSSFAARTYIIKFKKDFISKEADFLQNVPSVKPVFGKITVKENQKTDKPLTAEQNALADVLLHYYTIDIHDGNNSIVEDLLNNPDIESITPNYIYRVEKMDSPPNDPLYKLQWALEQLNAEKAWKIATGKGIVVGVVDTGIDYNHTDLLDQLWINSKEDINGNGRFDPWPHDVQINGVWGDLNGIDDDGNGYIDDVIGYDFVDQTIANLGDYSRPDPDPFDEGEHGTLVSGVIAAKANNDTGIAGLAFDSRIMTLRALDVTGNGETDDIAAAIVYAAVNGAKVLNFSFGENEHSPLLHDAIKFAYSMGCVMTASSGNNNWFLKHYPSDYPEVICVGGSNKQGKKYDAGNYGSRLDLVAPAQEVLTTQVGGGYKTTDGTSFAAPYTAAAAALLLEINPNLLPEEIRGILRSTAMEAGDIGWDIFFGAGLLNAGTAAESMYPSEVSISFPKNDAIFNKSKESVFYMTGKVTAPLFHSWQVFIGEGMIPQVWTAVSSEFFAQTINDTLARVNATQLKDTIHTARILVKLKNGGSLEERIYFNIISGENPLEITLLKQTPAFYDGKRIMLVTAVTNIPSKFHIRYRTELGGAYNTISQLDDAGNYHSIQLGNDVPRNVELFAEAVAVSLSGDTARLDFSFILSDDVFPTDNFLRKQYSLPILYLHNQVGDFYCNGKPAFSGNELQNLSFAKTFIYEFDGAKFNRRDTSDYGWLPVGFGDSNGDGKIEFFGMGNFESILTQAGENCGQIMRETIFKSPIGEAFWGESMFDFTGNGNPELLFYNDTSVFAYTFQDGKYSLLARAVIPAEHKRFGVVKGTAAGDFDGDGNPELLMLSGRGQVFIFEYSNGAFNLEFSDTNQVSDRNQYVCAADVDGDAKQEVIIGNYGSKLLFDKHELSGNIWTFRMLKSDEPNKYYYKWQEHFHGVRAGVIRRLNISYKNGISAGNIDGAPGDEIIISTFPNLYVLKWNAAKSTFEPMWHYPYSLANSAVVYDFDGNGSTEIGFATFSNTSFFEFTGNLDKPSAPAGFDGWALNDSAAYFFWNSAPNAEEYEIYRIERGESAAFAIPIGRTTQNQITIDTLAARTRYEITARSINRGMQNQFSDFSKIIDVYTHEPFFAKSIDVINLSSFRVIFTGSLPHDKIEPTKFEISNSSGAITSPATALVSNDSIAILTFSEPFDSGDYLLSVKSFPDYYRTPIKSSQIEFTLNASHPPDELYLKSLRLLTRRLLRLDFSEPVESETAADFRNYILNPFGSIVYSEHLPDSSFVLLRINPEFRDPARGKNYILNVKNVKALSGKLMTKGPGSSLGFVYSAENNDNAYIYPNPIRLSERSEIYIANLTAHAEIHIMTLEGDLLVTLNERDGNGGVEWDGKDRFGVYLKPGVYVFRVKGKNSEGNDVFEEVHKFAVTP